MSARTQSTKPISSKRRQKRSNASAKPKRAKINSRQKGAAGERQLAHFLTDHGIAAERGQQHAGGKDSPDVRLAADSPFHFEVKRVETGNPYNWMDQASRDAVNKIPVVAHRRNGRRWIAILFLDDFLNYVV